MLPLYAFPLSGSSIYRGRAVCLRSLKSQFPDLQRVGRASLSVWAQAGQCAVMAARPGQPPLVNASRKAAVTAMQAAVPKVVHAWREEVLQTAIWCDSS